MLCGVIAAGATPPPLLAAILVDPPCTFCGVAGAGVFCDGGATVAFLAAKSAAGSYCSPSGNGLANFDLATKSGIEYKDHIAARISRVRAQNSTSRTATVETGGFS
jgi:hypothetical protein